MITTCPNCTDTGPCDDCYQKVIDTQRQAWLDAQARADAWLDYEANQRSELCSAVTKGRTTKSTELYPGDFATLLQGLRDKKSKAAAA